MKTDWDYTDLADAYLQRPDYAESAIDSMLAISGIRKGSRVCDVGAGVAHLTLMLAERGLDVTAVEPNDAMRANGAKRTSSMPNVVWHEGTGEETGQSHAAFDLVTFGSSFNVCDRSVALKEVSRILKPKGWFACMWNHRDLDDPVQKGIESAIKEIVEDYNYGTRREDQTSVIDGSGLFGPVVQVTGRIIHEQSISDCIAAWRSHATLSRQAGADFPDVINGIEALLTGLNTESIEIPYYTRIWISQLI